MSKKDLLRQAKENPGTPPQTTARDLDVHFQGADLAVVTGAADQLNPQPRRPGGPVSIPFYRHLGKARRHMEMRGEPINARAAISLDSLGCRAISQE